MPIGLMPNVSSNSKEQHNGVYTDKEGVSESGSHTVTICVSAVIASGVLVLVALVCYREVKRRRKVSEVGVEKARREFIRQSVRMKLQEIQHLTDSASILELSESKTPLVTFGDVVTISPTISPAQSPLLQQRKIINGSHSRHQNEYHMLYHLRFNMDNKRRANHIPSRPTHGHLSYRQQQQIRNFQRQASVHQEHRRPKVQKTHSNIYFNLQVTSLTHTGRVLKPAHTRNVQPSPPRPSHDDSSSPSQECQSSSYLRHFGPFV